MPDVEPHFAGRKPHRFQIKDNPFFTLCISELLCRKSRLTVSMSVVGWWPGSSPRGCLSVLPDYRAHRGLLSSGLWNKCERTGLTPRRVPNKVQCGSSPAACGRYSVQVWFWCRHIHDANLMNSVHRRKKVTVSQLVSWKIVIHLNGKYYPTYAWKLLNGEAGYSGRPVHL